MTGVGALGAIFLIILAILWILMPFAIFGTKDILNELVKETKALRNSIDDLHLTLKDK